MNKHVRRFATALLAVLLLLQAVGICASAAEEATYQIRIYAGNVGATIGGASVWTVTGHYGDPIPFDTGMVSLPEGSKYYVKGVRESGLDNDMVSSLGVIREDADYVVAYGIKGKLVAYTVSFVDENGQQLAPSQTYYGNAGDKPVVAYLYVDGYQPQAYNLTKTLSENEGSNVFQFVYSPIVRPTPVPTPEPTAEPTPEPTEPAEETEPTAAPATTAPGTQTEPTAAPAVTEPTAAPVAVTEPTAAPAGEEGAEVTAAPEGEETEATAAPGEESAEATTAPEGEEAEATEAPAEEGAEATEAPTEAPTPTPAPTEPREIIDLDEGDTPLGNGPDTAVEEQKTDLQKLRVEAEAKFFVSTGMVVVALAALVMATYMLLRKHGIRH